MRTVFVIGAGANAEIGMPTGEKLKTKIATLLDFFWNVREMTKGDVLIYSALKQYCNNNNHFDIVKLCDAAKIIKTALPLSISIDNYIESQRGDSQIELCGKLAIVRSILAAEKDCALFDTYKRNIRRERNKTKIKQLEDSWYPSLFKKITYCCPVDKLAMRLNDISFIIFNYDRCFEYFMYNALMIYYQIHHEEAKKIVKNMHIVHPYGIVGELWDEYGELTFGEPPTANQLILLAEKIKTFTESSVQKIDTNNGIQYLVERTNQIFFLGFAYHDQNMELLFNHHGVLYVADGVPLSDNAICYGTGYEISDEDIDYLCSALQHKYKRIKKLDIQNKTCSKFLNDLWYKLSFKQAQVDQDETQR